MDGNTYGGTAMMSPRDFLILIGGACVIVLIASKLVAIM
jgi:hypothetical protein